MDTQQRLNQLATQGYTLIPDFLSPAMRDQVRTGLAPHLGSHTGRNGFEGFKTERVYTLVGRGRCFEAIAEDARVLALLDQLLLPEYLLTASQAICIYPGEAAQPLHFDDAFYPVPRPRPSISISTIVAVDAFTAENGGTEIIPGSHLWNDVQVAAAYAQGRSDIAFGADVRGTLASQLVPMVVPAGACMVFQGTLLHRGGANRSAAPRLAFSNQYCEPWARTQENFFHGVPTGKVRAMSPQLQSLLGYSIHPPFMGHVTASHPTKVLRADHANALTATDRADTDLIC